MAGEEASFADEIRKSHAAESVAQKMETGDGGDVPVQKGKALQVADGILRKRQGPAPNVVEGRTGERAQDLLQLFEGQFGNLGVGCICGEKIASVVAAKEGADQASTCGHPMGELLIDKGGGE